MRYAINIADLLQYSNHDALPVGPLLLLHPVLERDKDKIIMCEAGRWDGMANLVKENCTIKRWDAIYQIIRKGVNGSPGIPKHKLRIYRSKTGKGSWERI